MMRKISLFKLNSRNIGFYGFNIPTPFLNYNLLKIKNNFSLNLRNISHQDKGFHRIIREKKNIPFFPVNDSKNISKRFFWNIFSKGLPYSKPLSHWSKLQIMELLDEGAFKGTWKGELDGAQLSALKEQNQFVELFQNEKLGIPLYHLFQISKICYVAKNNEILGHALIICSSLGLIKFGKFFLNMGASVNHVDTRAEIPFTPLLIAVKTNNVKVIDWLIKEKVDINLNYAKAPTPLSVACSNENLEVVRILLKAGANVNQTLENKVTPLYIASQKGSTDIVKLLLKYGADPNICTEKEGISPLHIATYHGLKNVVELLLMGGANLNQPRVDNGLTPLFTCISQQFKDILLLFEDYQVNYSQTLKDGSTLLHLAVFLKDKELLEKLVKLKKLDIHASRNTDFMTPFLLACEQKNQEVIDWLLQLGADINRPNEKGITPLSFCIVTKDVETAKYLITKGANVNAVTPDTNLSALHCAIEVLSVELVKLLLENKADPNLKFSLSKENVSPLLIAIQKDSYPIAQLLLEYGANPNIGEFGVSPLCYTIVNNNLKMAELLLTHGANPNLMNEDGSTPLVLASIKKNQSLLDLLKKYGANN